MAPTPQNSSPLSLLTLRRPASAIGAACGNAARADLCGGRWATGVPTATGLNPPDRLQTSRGRRCSGSTKSGTRLLSGVKGEVCSEKAQNKLDRVSIVRDVRSSDLLGVNTWDI